MKEFLIDFWDKPIIREWADEYNAVTLGTTTANQYVKGKKGTNKIMMTTTVQIHDDDVALMFYLTFKDTLIYEKVDAQPRKW